jgi:RsiW-degrading membrane proteinase PrsW (M82 family)
MTYFALLVFALVPSLIWLFYFLGKDDNPEPKKVLFFAFLGGGLATVVTLFIQLWLMDYSDFFLYLTTPALLILSGVEEVLKYWAFFFTAKRTKEVDEPVDFVIYMITIALGFAAVENAIYLFSLETVLEMVNVAFFRFLSATLIHALASGILGVFLYVASKKSNKLFTILGLLTATLIHGIYNIVIFVLVDENYIGPVIIFIAIFLSSLFFFLLSAVKKIKKQ